MSNLLDRGAFNKRVTNFLFGLFIFSVFFPFIKIVSFTDIQPTTLGLAILIFLIYPQKILSRPIIVLGFGFLFSLFLVSISKWGMGSARNAISYISMFFIPAAVYLMMRCQEGFKEVYLKWSIYILFCVGFIQTFLIKDFLSFLLPRINTSSGRGVVGLAPEPTTYGIMCLFLMFICYLYKPKKMVFYQMLLLIQILIFAKSGTIVILLMIWGILYICFFFSIKRLVLGLLMLSFSFVWLTPFLVHTRMYKIVNLLITDPQFLFIKDMSGSARFFHVFFSVLGALQNFLIPNGFSSYAAYLSENLIYYPTYIQQSLLFNGITDKVMSGYGAALFEMGFVGLIFPIVLWFLLKRFFASNIRAFLMMSVVITVTIFCAIPLAFPYIGFLYGFLAYYSVRKSKLHPQTETSIKSKVSLGD